ncbi:hypothetical protein IF650_00940 [Cellulosimicrobium terreum]|nr:hypothetical protein [Cellulosimicrobium terreum]
MTTPSQELDPACETFRRAFDTAAAPYVVYVSASRAPAGAAPMIDVGLVVGIASLLLALLGSARTWRDRRARRTPDFQAMLDDLVDGRRSVDDVRSELARWRPDVEGLEVADLVATGGVDAYLDVLGRLGLPERVARRVAERALGSLALESPDPA